MKAPWKSIRAWLPAALGVMAVIGAGAFATLRQSRAADDIARFGVVATDLSKAAAQVQATAMSSEEARELRARHEDLTARMADAPKPGLFQADLVKTAKKAGLSVREIRPEGQRAAPPDKNPIVYPAYRVSVTGSYRQIAQFMERCKLQRLPARVRTVRIVAHSGQQNRRGQLSADVTLEAFQPARSAKGGNGA